MSILFLIVLHWEAIVCPLVTLLLSFRKSPLSFRETDLSNLFTSKEHNLERALLTCRNYPFFQPFAPLNIIIMSILHG